MGRTAKPRKRYVPKRVDIDATGTAMALATKLAPHQQAELVRPMRAAFERARAGTGGWQAWAGLADAMNVAEQLADAGICSDRMPEILAAQSALSELYARHQQRNSWTLRAAELAALDEGVLMHTIQLEHCTQGELRSAIFAVQRRMSQALAGNASPRALVCAGQLGAPKGTTTTHTHKAAA
jgi:hypothetical protein